ncbi:MAG: hypothetical protein Q9P14_02820 [candidate division KSB1 bacterium]|nr:hypothetical protein [candidate division KSB1 bacterium]MDQ7064496.1 hypothetical protein [candidate division KSB1 bacterium]
MVLLQKRCVLIFTDDPVGIPAESHWPVRPGFTCQKLRSLNTRALKGTQSRFIYTQYVAKGFQKFYEKWTE